MGFPLIFLYMWDPFRQQLISNHKFYIEQARKRLLSQFHNVSGEADKLSEEWLSTTNQWFDPDRHDPDDFQEHAYNLSITFYEQLTDMHHQTRLSVIAGMFHGWDKQLREWLSMELSRDFSMEKTKTAIWEASFSKIMDLLESFDWQVRAQPYYAQLDTCRLVVNVYKHGLGSSFEELKDHHPRFLDDVFGGVLGKDELNRFLDHTHLKVTDEHIAKFSDSIIAFWNEVPERTTQLTITQAPSWLSRAMEKDLNK